MARPKGSGPISRITSSSVQVGRLVIGADTKSGRPVAKGVEPMPAVGQDVAVLMDRARDRAANAIPLEDAVAAAINEQDGLLAAGGFKIGEEGDLLGPDLVPGSQLWLAFEAKAHLAKVRKFLPGWTLKQRSAVALAMRAGALLERQALLPVEPTTRTALETRERREAGRDAYNAGQTARSDRNRNIARREAARLWASDPELKLDFVGHDIVVRQKALGMEPRLVPNRDGGEGEVHPVRFDSIAVYIRDLRPKKSLKAR